MYKRYTSTGQHETKSQQWNDKHYPSNRRSARQPGCLAGLAALVAALILILA